MAGTKHFVFALAKLPFLHSSIYPNRIREEEGDDVILTSPQVTECLKCFIIGDRLKDLISDQNIIPIRAYGLQKFQHIMYKYEERPTGLYINSYNNNNIWWRNI